MSNLSPQRKRVVILAACLAILPSFGPLFARHIQSASYRHAFLIFWSLLLLTLLILVIVEFVNLKRSER